MQLSVFLRKYLQNSITFVIFVTSIVAGFLVLFLVYQHVLISEIRISFTNKPFILAGIQGLADENLIFLDEERLAEQIKRQNPRAQKVIIRKERSRRLLIEITAREPVVALKTLSGYFILSNDGVVLEKVREQPEAYPVMSYYQNIPYTSTQAGELLDFDDIMLGIAITEHLRSLGIVVSAIDISGQHMVRLITDQDQDILVTTEKTAEMQKYQLETLLKAVAKEDTDYSQIDLRFDKPVFIPKP